MAEKKLRRSALLKDGENRREHVSAAGQLSSTASRGTPISAITTRAACYAGRPTLRDSSYALDTGLITQRAVDLRSAT